jgi:voltage-gated sodium channel
MTLEGWAMEVVRPVMAIYPLSWIFFLIFILASTFTLLNLFIAVIVNAINQEGAADRTDPTATEIARLGAEIAALRSQLGDVRKPAPYATRRR